MKKMSLLKAMRKTACCVLAASLVLTGCGAADSSTSDTKTTTTSSGNAAEAVQATGSGTVEKKETVFVNTDGSGNPESITVSDWLKNKKNFATITDATNLENVENIKGNETFDQSGDVITFHSENGDDIYYRGSVDTSTTLPVSLAVTYTLDGKKVTRDELDGASGHLKLKITYTNNTSVTETIKKKDYDVKVPFLAVTAMMVPADTVKNLTVDHGRTIESGDNIMIVGYGFPGMNENFDLTDKDGLFSSDVEIEADVTDCDINLMMSYYTSELFADSDLEDAVDVDSLNDSLQKVTDTSTDLLDDIHSVDDIQDLLDQIDDAATDLNDGAKELADGASDLNTGAVKVNTGAAKLDAKIALLSSSLSTVADGSSKLSSSMSTVSTKSKSLASGAKGLDAGVDALVSSMNSMYSTISKSITSNEANIAKLEAGIKQLKAGIAQLQAAGTLTDAQQTQLATYQTQLETYSAQYNQLKGANTALGTIKAQMDQAKLADNLKALASGSQKVYDGATALSSGLSTISSKTTELSAGIAKLHSGSILLKDGSATLAEGTKELADGSKKLKNGAKELADGTDKLSGAFSGNITDLLNTGKAIQQAASDYQTFTLLPENGSGKVSFVIKTE